MRGGYALVAPIVALTLGCVEQEPARPTEADWTVIRQNVLKKAPKPKYAVNADLEGKVTYLGLDVDKARIKPGEPFVVTHYWKVVKPVAGWKIFVHLDSGARSRFINADHTPIEGRYPASMWKAGEIVRDSHSITLPADWNAPELVVFTGLWKGNLRMRPEGPQDDQKRIIAATLPVSVRGRKSVAKLKSAVAARADKPVKIDGKLDEPVWKVAKSTGAFVNTMTGGSAPMKTEAKLAWDDKQLYIAFENEDEDVWSSFTKRDDKLWTEEAVEVLIDANGDGRDYIELQVNPNGVIFDSYLKGYRKNDNAWNSGVKAAVVVNGTLNKRGDKDKAWTVELAIPWADMKGKGQYALTLPPKLGDTWRINLFRLDKPGKSQRAAGWSPPLVGDFHKLSRFGELTFGNARGEVPKISTAKGSPVVNKAKPVTASAAKSKPAPKAPQQKKPLTAAQ